jgi:F420H(2)-dependent quinone reductase
MSITEQVLRVHEAIYKGTGGLIGHKTIGVPTLLLRTVGRRTGAARTNALVYARDGDDYLVVASNGGADKAPGWYFNLREKADVEIQIARERRPARARVLEPSDPDYARLWKIVNENNRDRYNGYKKMTSRPIPIVALTPAG